MVDLLQRQTDPFGSWSDAPYMAIAELCDNALQHGRNDLGGYIAADRIVEPRREMRLVIADLGIGIPEHIRTRHPEWHDDTAAITRALARGVSGTGDPHHHSVMPRGIRRTLYGLRKLGDSIRGGR